MFSFLRTVPLTKKLKFDIDKQIKTDLDFKLALSAEVGTLQVLNYK